MTHEFVSGSSNAIIPPASEANSINLDLSTRNKIVIHPRSKDCIVKPKSIFPPLRTQSIFKKEHRSEPLIDEKTSHAAEAPKIERTFAPTSQQQVLPPKLRDSDWEAKKVAKLAQARQAIDHIDKKPIEKRSPPPVIPRPRPTFQSPYVEEYAKCGCTKDGGNPCRRCQLMLLSDRFCDLVDLQCRKWNAAK